MEIDLDNYGGFNIDFELVGRNDIWSFILLFLKVNFGSLGIYCYNCRVMDMNV